jgi:hypothetical protein
MGDTSVVGVAVDLEWKSDGAAVAGRGVAALVKLQLGQRDAT